MSLSLNLLVLKARDIDKLADFYSLLGLHFRKHRHGSGPEHYASEIDGSVFEIYPLSPSDAATSGVRLGFKVDSVERAVRELECAGAQIVRAPSASPWGHRAVVRDVEGHIVELLSAA